jgi:sarcosine oxidase, subunit gamma
MLENRSAARRIGVLAPLEPLRYADRIAVRALPPDARFTLRLAQSDAASIDRLAGMSLAMPINRVSAAPPRLAARLGPDEWLLITAEADAEVLQAEAMRTLANRHHALIDIGHRNIGIEVSGLAASAVLNAGCPLDLGPDKFASGAASRTLFGKAEIVLFRLPDVAEARGAPVPHYRIECWRSFGRYVHGLLAEAAAEFKADP